jgi:transmembrane sensor
MLNTRLNYLFERNADQQLSAKEQDELMLLMADKANEQQVKELIEKGWNNFEPTAPVFTEEDSEIILTNVLNSDPSVTSQKGTVVKRINFSAIAAAAVILMVFSAFLFFYLKNKNAKTNNQIVQADILPGSNKAVLILANHKRILLDDAAKGEIAKQSGMVITKLKGGEVIYTVLDRGNATSNAEVSYNTLETPRGGQFQITLPDGTKVWLNSASSLHFPTTFAGKERHVELTGEGYFEVAHNKNMPFTVAANGVDVKVLGTHFDIMAYVDEPVVNTTLLEGSVALQKGGLHQILKPGEAGIASKANNTLLVEPADMEQAVAWKNGFFIFKDQNINDVMRQVSRWYNVDVEFRGSLNSNIGGKTSRYKNISELLTNMQLTGSIHYKIEGRKVIIMP